MYLTFLVRSMSTRSTYYPYSRRGLLMYLLHTVLHSMNLDDVGLKVVSFAFENVQVSSHRKRDVKKM